MLKEGGMINIFGYRGFFRELSWGGNYNQEGLRIEEFALICRAMLVGQIARGAIGRPVEEYVRDSFIMIGNWEGNKFRKYEERLKFREIQ